MGEGGQRIQTSSYKMNKFCQGVLCNFFGSVSLQQRFETAVQCYSSVKAQNFIWQAKESTLLRHEGGLTPKERPNLGSSFYMFHLFPLSLLYINQASQEGCFTCGSPSGPWVFFCSISFLFSFQFSSVQFSRSVVSDSTLCDPMNRSTPGLPVHHQLPEFTQTCTHRVSDAVQTSHLLLSPSPPAPNPSQHQSLFQ